MLHNQDKPIITFVLQSMQKKGFAIAKVREGAAGGQMPRLSKKFESVNRTERVCLYSQTFSIIVAFGLLLRLL